ncbi:uncharacterized protein An08g12230 [Aspergillus niger]|uniref:Contig An08c0340, genomic contig n=2 Tax=Aspergillus niger TaxID=5061 RepID=A2QSX0_ASPNC|nr:uncharacterized protein An08g12230 [Aspergillus niger]CAK40098.1 unnamed protein product [Aspergillus niger]
MLLLDLPGELLLCVMDHLERAKDIHSLCLTNSHVYRQLLPALYRFNIRFQNSSALHWAARYGKLELIQTMCVYRARVNVYLHGYTPLHFAAMFGQAPVVRWLLSYDGIDVNCRGEGLGLTPLGVAVRKKDVEVVQVLLSDAHIKLNGRNDDGFTALHEATTRGYLSVAKLLLAAPGVDANVGDTCGQTALWWATKRSDEILTKRLLCEDDLDLNVVGRDGSTSLHHAVQYRNRTIARLLLCEERLDINVPDMTGWTPLVWAVHQADIDMVRLLLARDDLQLDPIFAGNASALGLAAERGHTKIVNLFLEHRDRLDINLPTQVGETPLCRAAAAGHHDVVDLLLQDPQLDVNRADLIGRSPLCWAVYAGHLNVPEHNHLDAILRACVEPACRTLSRSTGTALPLSVNSPRTDRSHNICCTGSNPTHQSTEPRGGKWLIDKPSSERQVTGHVGRSLMLLIMSEQPWLGRIGTRSKSSLRAFCTITFSASQHSCLPSLMQTSCDCVRCCMIPEAPVFPSKVD